jgi:hypothetical protein
MSKVLSRLRRAAVLAVALLLVPTAALALFRPSATVTLAVGTASLGAPSDFSASWSCPQGTGNTVATVKTKAFTGVAGADGYVVRVSRGGVVLDQKPLSRASESVDLQFDRTGGTVEVSVRATLKAWTGAPATVTFTC